MTDAAQSGTAGDRVPPLPPACRKTSGATTSHWLVPLAKGCRPTTGPHPTRRAGFRNEAFFVRKQGRRLHATSGTYCCLTPRSIRIGGLTRKLPSHTLDRGQMPHQEEGVTPDA